MSRSRGAVYVDLVDKFDEFAATAPPRPPQAPGALAFYGERPLAGVQTTPPFRLPMDMAGPAPPNMSGDYPAPLMTGAAEPAPKPAPRKGDRPARARPPAQPKRAGKAFIDRIEDNGMAVLIEGNGDNYATRNVPAQQGWKEGQWIKPGRRPVP